MLKGQISRVPWPGNYWMPFTFQCFSSPQTFTLTPTSYLHWTSTPLHSICLWTFLFNFFKVLHGHIRAPQWHKKGPL